MGQAGAAQFAIARVFLQVDGNLRGTRKLEGLLRRDPRERAQKSGNPVRANVSTPRNVNVVGGQSSAEGGARSDAFTDTVCLAMVRFAGPARLAGRCWRWGAKNGGTPLPVARPALEAVWLQQTQFLHRLAGPKVVRYCVRMVSQMRRASSFLFFQNNTLRYSNASGALNCSDKLSRSVGRRQRFTSPSTPDWLPSPYVLCSRTRAEEICR